MLHYGCAQFLSCHLQPYLFLRTTARLTFSKCAYQGLNLKSLQLEKNVCTRKTYMYVKPV